MLARKLNVVYCWPSLLLLLLALAFVIVVAVESACDGRVVPFSSKYEVRTLQNVAKKIEIISNFAILGKNCRECSILEGKVPYFQARHHPEATSRSDVRSDPGHEA